VENNAQLHRSSEGNKQKECVLSFCLHNELCDALWFDVVQEMTNCHIIPKSPTAFSKRSEPTMSNLCTDRCPRKQQSV
jgi:hypothetical protein